MNIVFSFVSLVLFFVGVLNHGNTCGHIRMGAHSWLLHAVAPLGDQSPSPMTRFSTQSHYPDTELASPRSLPTMQSARLGRAIGVIKVGNIAPRAGIEPTFLAFRASVPPFHAGSPM